MKLSQLSEEQLKQLTTEQVTKIVYGNWKDNEENYDVALLLGGKALVCRERAEAAAYLWRSGRVRWILPTGGVKWETELGELSESSVMKHYLLELGVPEDVILQEDEAKTTVENMLYATILMQRVLKISNVRKVAVVTSAAHLNRAVRHAENYLPRTVKVCGFCIPQPESDADHWFLDPVQKARTERELVLLWRLIKVGMTPDIEF